MDILLMGPPGAGKGTQGALLAEALGLPKFATGDLLRDAVKRGTPVGLKAKAAMEAGHLVSDEIIMGVIRDEPASPRRRMVSSSMAWCGPFRRRRAWSGCWPSASAAWTTCSRSR